MESKPKRITVKEIFRRGILDTWMHYKDDWKHLFQNVFSAIVAMLILWLFWGRNAMNSEVQVLIAGVIGAVAWGIIVFIYNLITAPTKLKYEEIIDKMILDAQSAKVDLVASWVVYPLNRDSAIGIEVINKTSLQIECYSFLRKVTRDGADITKEVTYYTQRLSWNGGADKELGIKYIEAAGGTARVNVGTAEAQHFCFQTDKGGRNIQGNGNFMIDLELRGTVDGGSFTPIALSTAFVQKGEKISLRRIDDT